MQSDDKLTRGEGSVQAERRRFGVTPAREEARGVLEAISAAARRTRRAGLAAPVLDREQGDMVRGGRADCGLLGLPVGPGRRAHPASMAETNPRPDIAYRPVVDTSPYTIVIAWPVRARASYVAAFVRTAIEVAFAEGRAPARPRADVR